MWNKSKFKNSLFEGAKLIHSADPTVTAGSDAYFPTWRPTVRLYVHVRYVKYRKSIFKWKYNIKMRQAWRI